MNSIFYANLHFLVHILVFACFMKISFILHFMRLKYIASINLIFTTRTWRYQILHICTNFVITFSLYRDCVIYEMKDGFSTNVKLLIVIFWVLMTGDLFQSMRILFYNYDSHKSFVKTVWFIVSSHICIISFITCFDWNLLTYVLI